MLSKMERLMQCIQGRNKIRYRHALDKTKYSKPQDRELIMSIMLGSESVH